MSNLSTKIYNNVVNTMQSGDTKTDSRSEYSEEDLYLIRDLFVNSGELSSTIEVVEDVFLERITIRHLWSKKAAL